MNVPDIDDGVLVDQSRQGVNAAYGELVRRYQQPVFAVCYRFLGERQDAEDAVQEVFVRAHRYLSSFDRDRPFGPWIRRIATNYCLTVLKREDTVSLPLYDEREASVGSFHDRSIEHSFIVRDQAETVRLAVASLPDHYRSVIVLRHYHDQNYQEMATTLGLPLNTVKSHLLRARKLLMERLRHE